MKCYSLKHYLDSNRITMAIKNQLKVELWNGIAVPTVVKNEIKEEKVESKENVKETKKESKIKKAFKKK